MDSFLAMANWGSGSVMSCLPNPQRPNLISVICLNRSCFPEYDYLFKLLLIGDSGVGKLGDCSEGLSNFS